MLLVIRTVANPFHVHRNVFQLILGLYSAIVKLCQATSEPLLDSLDCLDPACIVSQACVPHDAVRH